MKRTVLALMVILISFSLQSCFEFGCDGNENAQSLDHDGETREYLVHVPPGYDGSTAFPVVLSFHGYGGFATDFMMEEAEFNGLADTENFIAVYPQGSCLDGFSHWNAGLNTPENKSSTDDLGFVEAMISKLESDFNIDSERIYACGFSNGGMMAYALACYKSDLIAAVGSVSGVMLTETVQNCAAVHPTAVIHIHGTDDEVLPYDGGDGHGSAQSMIDHWLGFNNCGNTAQHNISNNVEKIEYAIGDSGVAVVHYKVINGGHEWFDLNHDGNNTEQILWDFFSQYDVNGRR